MRQRVAIASAKAIEPSIYVMDEPSANLDMDATKMLAELLRELKAQGKTVLIAEHRLYYLRELADRILYLRDGEIVDEFLPDNATLLNQEHWEQLGLRSMTLDDLPVQQFSAPTAGKPTLRSTDFVNPSARMLWQKR